MRRWLMKSEPETFGIEDLRRKGREHWDGVRNYQARNNMMAMSIGDLAFFYHSSADPSGVAGVCRVVREAYPDDTALDPSSTYFDPKATPEKPIWHMVDVEFVEAFPRVVALSELKATPGLESMAVTQRGSRLSITPVSEQEWKIVMSLAYDSEP